MSADQFGLPPQELAVTEVESFLTWLFNDLARRPPPMALREVACVVRYLQFLESNGVPKVIIARGSEAIREYRILNQSKEDASLRHAAGQTVKIVWSDLLSFGEFEPSSRREAQRFFKKHSSRWSHPWLAPALKFLEEFELPPGATPPTQQEHLVGRHLSARGSGNPYLESDLSERVAAADYALERAQIPRRRASIAKVLEKSPLARRKGEVWGPNEVRNRVRSYTRQKDHMPIDHLADKWIWSYRFAMSLISPQFGIPHEPSGDEGS